MRTHPGIWLVLMLALATAPAQAMDLPDVFALLDAGVGEDVIMEQMDSEGATFLLETEDILALRRSGASDRLLRAMIESGDTRRQSRDAAREAPSTGGDDWTEDYYAPDRNLRVEIAYDPFGYHWYASPSYFVYYYPFRAWDVGSYYAGWYHWRWSGWNGYWPTYYRNYCDAYYWNHYRRPYYHPHGHRDYRDNVRYRSRDDRAGDGRAPYDRNRAGVEERTSRSRGAEGAKVGTSRTRRDVPTTRERSLDRPRETPRTRSREVAPPSRSPDRSTPTPPSRSSAPRQNDRSDGGSRGRIR